MSKVLLNEFGKRLIQNVRDRTILQWKKILSGQMKAEHWIQTRSHLKNICNNAEELSDILVPEVAESMLFHLLQWFDEEEQFRITAEIDDKKTANLAEESDGFAGELFTEDGWISRFGKEQ